VIFSLAVFGLVMPNFTWSTPGGTFSAPQEFFLGAMCLGLYGIFLAIQTTRHRTYFLAPSDVRDGHHETGGGHGGPASEHSWLYHAALLALYLALVIKLAEDLGHSLNHGLDDLNAPPALGAFVVAVLVLAPEGLGAVRAALANQLQRTVNILLGSVLATLALTFPALLFVSLNRGVSLVSASTGSRW